MTAPLAAPTYERPRRHVIAAAIKLGEVICHVKRPGRHNDIVYALAKAGHPIPIDGKEGFLTDDGLFVNRWLALQIAKAAGQLKDPKKQHGGQLFSEDVW